MKNIYTTSLNNSKLLFFALTLLIIGNFSATAQVKRPFKQRTSSYSPTKTIYNVKGDFAMIGNTNLTLQTYNDNSTNNYVNMKYVDIDGVSSTFNSSSADLNFSNENGAVPSCSNIVFAGLYWTGRSSNAATSPMTFSVTKNNVQKSFDKRKISIKGPASSGYTQITANNNDIYYPETTDGFMYSAFAEVTDYVKLNGIGSYTVADIALVEGDGGDTGFYGGWSLVVVYENSKMKFRDITVFDGHAYIAGGVGNFQLPISGFNAVQSGQVNMKLGVMAGEGDRPIQGDYLQIQKKNTNDYLALSHANNATNNFFNSSIYTGGNNRNPNLLNNTGLDISVFNIPNSNNSVIDNNQTSTNFRYGSTQDTYVIFATVMAVDAYIPQIEGVLTAETVNNVAVTSQNPTALPGQEIGYNVNIKNLGTEALNNTKITIPVPFNATYVPGSAIGNILFSPLPTPNNVYFDANLGANGSVVWDLGTLPLPSDPSTLLGTLKFKFKTTTDCSILVNTSCGNGVLVYGSTTGVGATTNTTIKDQPLIRGYNTNGQCAGEPIAVPLTVNINATNYIAQNCSTTSTTRTFAFCNVGSSIALSQVSGSFPAGSMFYNQYPVTGSAIQYTTSNPFPAVSGSSITYYAVPQNGGDCVFPFKINICNPINAVDDNMPQTLGIIGNSNIGNIFANNGNGADILNGSQVAIGLVNLTVTTPATPLLPGLPVPSINLATGNVSVPVGTPAGNYFITYQICEKANPTNCDTAIVKIPVSITPIDAVNDLIPQTVGAVGNPNAGNIFANNGSGIDTLNGVLATLGLVNLSVISPAVAIVPGSPVPSVNILNGTVIVPQGTPEGNYQITYRICESLNSNNCDTAVVTIPVTKAVIDAVNDTMPSTNGATGNNNAGNIFASNGSGIDTLNGTQATIGQVNLSVTAPATPNTAGALVPTIDLSTGNVIIPAGTPAGSYTITYQICEKLNPTNCDTAIVTIPVTKAVIDAQNDAIPSTNGATGNTNAGNIFANNGSGIDTLNGTQATIGQVNLTVTTPATPNTAGALVPTIDLATGNVVIPAGTPAGSYTITYQICEKLNPTNCDTAVVTIPVTKAVIDAQNDAIPSTNGATGNTNAGNIFANNGSGIDTLNGTQATIGQVNLTVTTPATPNTAGALVPTIDLATGNVVIPAGTPAGSYTITYQICEKLNPTNCDTAIVTIPVTKAIIDAQNDAIPSTNGATGNTNAGNIFASNGSGIDTLNGTQVLISNVNLSVTTPATPNTAGALVPTIDLATGNVVIPAGTPAGSYTITYQICEKLNPTNCDTAVVTIPVAKAAIDAVNDTMPSTNGATGNTNAGNIFASNGSGIDTLNGTQVLIGNVNLTITTPATPSTTGALVPTIDLATGNVTIPAGTPAGNYTITYQICEKLNPTNCDTAIVTIPVAKAVIDAQNDAMPSTNGATGNTNAGNIFASNGSGIDTLNGTQATIGQVNLSVTAPATPNTAGALVPTIDLATGNVVIPAGTPAGSYTITYQICEKLNPTNCDTAVVTIPVTKAVIDAQNDAIPSTNGATGNTNAGNIFASNGSGIDTLNGAQVLIGNVNLSVTTPATPNTAGALVPTIDLATGNVVIPAGTPAGSYTITYQICEKLNPTNCDTAVVTIPVTKAVIDAVNDTIPSTNGATGSTNAGNIFASNGSGIDTLNGTQATIGQVNLSVTTPATPNTAGALVPTIDLATGNVVIPAGTPAGSYTITYQICEKLNPTNCDTAIVTIPVTKAVIDAVNDTMPSTNGATGSTNAGNIFASNGSGIDTLNGTQATIGQVNLTVTTPATPNTAGALVPTIDLATGNVVIPAGTPAGNYTITYQICEKLNPTNCDTAVVTIPVTKAIIDAVNDTIPSTNGATGNNNAGNIFASNGSGIDTLNGAQVLIGNVNLTITTPATPNTAGALVPTIDLATGNVVIPAGTPAGNYTITYQICEKLNPTNCDTAVVTIPVAKAVIDAQNDAIPSTNGATGSTNAGNIFANNGSGIDTLNGAQVIIGQVNLTVTTPATPNTAGALVPTIDLATGNVVIPAGTPAGNYTITYQICEKLNPTNCDTAVVTIPVTKAVIDAQNDAIPSTNGATGNNNAGNIFASNGSGIDTLNGAQVLIGNVNLTITTPATPNTAGALVPTIDLATGNVVIPAGTPAGNYTITYQICEKLNPTNCDTAVVTIPVAKAVIDAQNDAIPSTNGATGSTNAGNIFANNGSGIDTLNGAQVIIGQVNLTVTTPATPNTAGALVPTIDLATGNVVIPAGTPAGNYTITYQICEKLNPTNCDTAVVTIPVTKAVIDAQNDAIPSTNGATGSTNAGNIFASNGSGIDTLNGAQVLIGNVNLSVTTPATPNTTGALVPTIDLATGNVVIPAGTPAGSYTITYQICEKLNPTNCDTAVVTIPVAKAVIDAQNDAIPSTNGATGSTNAGNIFASNGSGIDTLNGAQVLISNVNLSVTTPATPNTAGALVPTIDLATGNVVIPAGTPAGSYTITYQICEKLNPTNCDTAVVTIPVTKAVIDAVNDTMPSTNGATGSTNAGNIFASNGSGIDTLNGAQVLISNVNLSVTTPATPNTAGALVPTIDLATGNVVIPAGTPAGNYTITYQICEKLNPTNCDTAVVMIPVAKAAIDAQNDAMPSTNGATGSTNAGNIFASNGSGIDTLNGTQATIGQVNLTVTTPATPTTAEALVPTIDLTTGNVVIPAGTPAGSYTITYQICEKLNPTNCDTAVVTIPVYTPSIKLLKEGTYVDSSLPVGVSVGDIINYTFTVINNGTIALTNITVTDPLVTVIGGPIATLAAGASDSTTFTATYTVTQTDIDAGQVNNLAITTGTPPSGPPVTDTSSDPTPCDTCEPVVGCPDCTSTELPSNPSIKITKDGTYVDNNGDGITNAGDTVTYAFVITNTGNVTLTNVTVTDNNAVVSGGPIATLVVGATDSTTFTAVHTITQADITAGQVNNLALATGTTPSGTSVTDESSDPTPCTTCTPSSGCLDCTNTPLINAVNDIFNAIACNVNGVAGNILANDTYGSTFVNTDASSQVNFTVLSGTNSYISISSTGNVNISSGIAAGTYTITYQICSALSPNVCDKATVTINIVDTTAPMFVEIPPANVTVECNAVPTAPTLTATDTCGSATVTFTTSTTNGNCPGNYTITNTWTATDASGNITIHLQTVTVQDTTAPTFVEALPANITAECSAVPTAPTLTATDNCGTATVSYSETTAPGNCAGNYILTRTWTATDLCGLTATHVQTITVQDTTAPTFVETLPANITVECSAVPTAPTLTATDNCGTATVAYSETTAPGTCAGNYILTRTWTATDLCGLTATHIQTVTVQDTTAPTFVEALPADVTVECSAVPTAPTLTATDNCGTATVSYSETTTAGNCAGSYTLTRTWTATDLCGLTATHIQTVTVQDTTAPTFVEALPANVTVECSTVPTAPTLTATDNCGTATVSYSETTAPGTCAGNYILTRTWTATDLCGLTATHIQTVTVQDTTAPTFVEALPADITVECSTVPTAPILTATDNCGTATVAYSETSAPGTCAGNYILTRTWTATDLCGLTATHIQTITVQDTTAPTFVEALPANVTVECSAVPTAPTLTATDNCGTATVSYSETTTAGNCAGSYTLTRTWTATDLCGLTATHIQTITVQDTTAPTFVEALPANVTVECSTVPTAPTLTATDNCGTATVSYSETTAPGTCAGNYILTRTWTATDLCGLTATHIQTVTVQDTTAPTFVEALPADITVECSTVPTAPILTATDNCGTATVAYSETTTAGNCAGSYTLTRTWTATDLCGLTATHIQTITVQDTTAPTFVEALPANITAECSAVPTAPTLTATDNCGTATVAYSETTTAGNCAGSYTLTRTWTATDLCGLTATHIQTITVQDTTAPTFVEALPANITAECSAVPTAPNLTATDNCGTATVAYSETTAPGTCAGNYILTRTWTATDLCGLTATHIQTVTVQDTTAPTFVEALPANVTVECSAVPTAPTLTATDNCGTATVSYSETSAPGTCAGNYILTRTWTATDLCGLTATHIQTITVQDTTAPTFVETLPANITVECSAVPTAPTLTATDNCGTATVAYSETNAPGTCAGSYTLTRTWTATDLCGLTATHIQTITVQDTTAPTFTETLPANLTVECSAVPTAPTLTATDNCGTATVAYSETTAPGNCAGNYILTRTWTATDLCGLTATHIQTITVQDTTAPTFVEALPADVTAECSAVPTAPTLTATDNCGTATVSYSETTAPGNCAGSYTLTRTWTATDICGLTATHIQTVTVQDTTAPTFVEALPANITAECSAVPTAPTLTATDNCGTATVAYSETSAPGTCAGNYILTRTWTATDLCGLTATHVQTITVQDTTAPTFNMTVPADVTVSCGSIPAAATMTAADSCGTAAVSYSETSAPGACAGDSIITRTWTATDSCGNAASVSQIITVEDNVAPTTNTTFDAVLNVTCDSINAVPDLQFADACSSVENTTFDEQITNQTASGYTIIRTWTATDECGNIGTATQTVNVAIRVPVETIPSELCIEDLSIDLFTLLDPSVEQNGTWIDTNNSGGLNGSTFNPAQAAVGYYLLSYVIPGGDCPRTIEINMNVNDDCVVLPACTINVHNAMSPNNDGMNDFFQIDGLECYPNNSVEIYNRWGVLVFDAVGYDNNSKVFRGISEGRVTVKQESELPAGTYFYILKYSDAEGNNKEKASYLYITR